MKEIFAKIEGYPNYEVSNLGRVKSLSRIVRGCSINGKEFSAVKQEKLMKQIKTYTGYPQVNLYKDGKTRVFHTHRLVAKAFIDNPENKRQVNHKDGDKTNNHVSNLEWVTPYENTMHAWKNGLSKAWATGKFGSLAPKSRPVMQMTLSGEIVREWDCGLDAVREGGFRSSGISRCCNNIVKHHGGFIWKFKEKDTAPKP